MTPGKAAGEWRWLEVNCLKPGQLLLSLVQLQELPLYQGAVSFAQREQEGLLGFHAGGAGHHGGAHAGEGHRHT